MTEEMKNRIDTECTKYSNPALFETVIDWYLKNIWHDASEKPEDIEADIIIVGDILNNKLFYACCTYKTPFLKWEVVKHWAYISDIFPDK